MKYSMCKLICEVITCCVWSCDTCIINVYDKIVIGNQKKHIEIKVGEKSNFVDRYNTIYWFINLELTSLGHCVQYRRRSLLLKIFLLIHDFLLNVEPAVSLQQFLIYAHGMNKCVGKISLWNSKQLLRKPQNLRGYFLPPSPRYGIHR